MSKKIRIRVDAECLNGEALETLVAEIQGRVLYALGDGLLTGGSATEVERYSVEVEVAPRDLPEDALTEHFSRRLMDGDLALVDIPARLARYGLMERSAFVAEMRERMGLEDDDNADEDGGTANGNSKSQPHCG